MLLQKSKIYEKEIFNLNVTTEIDNFVLHNNYSYVKYFLKRELDHEEVSKLLILATKHNRKRIIKILMKKGNNYIHSVIQAAESGYPHLIDRYRKKYKKDINDFSWYVVEGSVTGKNYGIMQYVLNDDCADRGFEEACFVGDRKLIKYFKEYHSCSLWDEGFWAAAAGGHLDIVKYFIDEYNMDSYEIGEALASCVEGTRDQKVIDYLISKGPDGYSGATWEAAKKGYKDLVDLFISLGDNDWEHAYDGAVLGKQDEMISFFEEKMKEAGIKFKKIYKK